MKAIIQTITIFIVGAIIIVFTGWLVNNFQEPKIIEKEKTIEKILSIPECSLGFDSYKSLIDNNQSLLVLKDVYSYALGGRFIKSHSVTVNRTGEIACGFLYIRAKTSIGALDESYDSVYVNPHDFGGHLIRSRSIPIPNQDSDITEILLPLDSIPYLSSLPYNPNVEDYSIADWVKLLNVTNKVKFNIALSVEDRGGIIEEMRIAYKCWNPETGKETHDCQLSK